ncbi:hypothetical protein LTR10_020460 [Elasticomyces elasticus]|uniref:NmrA-like domain-containing protein n=1 Tax=Exophiala sideris TaxID=1016849 RepID=A0ABR0J437_9EURO|nr:hypothetical protein LTR10_020460 [Elasticomyces elasticus]KAK5027014.1 hypothetical protein LTS07_007313 [Exophiala sideris]KAK5034018.1 hypothetical protein LTR13_006618 [Exophiala sideris]KAK5055707.1 hypothetical protein LTR69_008082 [Exophiala sideris]KAK5180960.1 hypothetical protein LTR44_006780 [Eurotiomycetes sp. CCFEE 6388]
MVVVVVAGGLGDLGRLIVNEICAKKKHEVYVLSRKAPKVSEGLTTPKVLQTDYSQESLSALLRETKAHTVISALNLDFAAASESQIRLIKAASESGTVQRFIPSEFNINYDLDDKILPYEDKKFHAAGRRELEKTSLEYTFIYCGMFMDYFGLPYFPTDMRALYTILDIPHSLAVVSGDGTATVAITYTKDVARLVARSIDLPKWPRVYTVAGAEISSNDLVELAERILGMSFKKEADSMDDLYARRATLLPSNAGAAVYFPGGEDQLKALIADLSVPLALGAYDVAKVEGSVDLVKALGSDAGHVMGLEEFFDITAKEKSSQGSSGFKV